MYTLPSVKWFGKDSKALTSKLKASGDSSKNGSSTPTEVDPLHPETRKTVKTICIAPWLFRRPGVMALRRADVFLLFALNVQIVRSLS